MSRASLSTRSAPPFAWRSTGREMINVFCTALTLPFWGLVRAAAWVACSGESHLFCTAGQWLSLVPGACGVWLRRAYYRMTLERCGPDLSIGFLSWIAHRGSIMGNRVSVGAACVLGTVEAGDDVLIGTNVQILSGRHQHFPQDRGGPMNILPTLFERTRLGTNVWIGNSAVVMAEVGDHCIIGAGSVVVHPIATGSVAVGNPARVCRQVEPPVAQGIARSSISR